MRILNKQTGETIIEVMLSVVILGFTMTTIYVIARRSLNTGQAASERSQVLAIVESQIERLKAMGEYDENVRQNDAKNIFLDNVPFCVTESLEIRRPVTSTNVQDCYTTTFPGGAGLMLEIVYNADGPDSGTPYDDDTFNITTNWTRVDASDSPEVLKTAYRLHPKVPPSIPNPICGDSRPFDFTQHLNDNAASIPSIFVFDVYHDPLGGAHRYESVPDFPIDSSFNILVSSACVYDAVVTSWCTRPDGSAPNLGPPALCFPIGLDQSNEAARISLYDSGIGAVGNFQCTGTKLAYFNTVDNSNNATVWSSTTTVNNATILANGRARCIRLEHICKPGLNPPMSPVPNCSSTQGQSSVHIHEIRWNPR